MKRFYVFLLTLLSVFGVYAETTSLSLAELLKELDNTIVLTAEYDKTKTDAINKIKSELEERNISEVEHYYINNHLFLEYESYICDSALYYANENIILAQKLSRPDFEVESKLHKASAMSRAGLFIETIELLQSIDRRLIPDDMLPSYFQCYSDTYQYLSEYAVGTEYENKYVDLLQSYRDSTLNVVDKDSFIGISMYAPKLLADGKIKDAQDFLLAKLPKFKSGTREYSVLASILAYAYKVGNNGEGHRKYLAISAISDIKGVIKENMAIRELAEFLYADKDINRANSYLKKSLEDANFFSARMRNNQSVKMLPIVDMAYNDLQDNYQNKLQIGIVIISLLLVVLLIFVVFIFKQMKKLSRSHKEIAKSKDDLEVLNKELSNMNRQLGQTNSSLSEANHIKEEYIGQFMVLCSTYINTLVQYRKVLYRQATTGSIDELHKSLKSAGIINELLKDFYANFDSAFLKIFPHFVERINDLLPDEAKITLKPGETLNTELRVYALIRLGINDSNKISKFLRCSITTIYTYRSKMKNKSLYKEDFDAQVMKITSF